MIGLIQEVLRIVGYETLQNVPSWVGFVFSIRLWRMGRYYRHLALVLLVGGVFSSSALISLTEPLLAGYGQPSWGEFFTNSTLFSIVSVAALLYFTKRGRWIGWRSDLVAGFVLGTLLAIAQSLATHADLQTALGHVAAFALMAAMTLCLVRYIVNMMWRKALSAGIGLTVASSLVIALIDKVPRYLLGG
jgi:hypothetical protein